MIKPLLVVYYLQNDDLFGFCIWFIVDRIYLGTTYLEKNGGFSFARCLQCGFMETFHLFTAEWQVRHGQAIKEKVNALNNFGPHIIWLWSIKL